MRLPAILLACLLLVPLAPVRADGGGATDFPDRWEHARDVAPGIHSGTVGPSDKQDWVRVTHLAAKGVRVTVHGQVWVTAPLDDQGRSVLTGPIERAPGLTRLHGHAPAGLRVGVQGYANQTVEYALVIEVVDLPDLTIEDVRVRADEGRLVPLRVQGQEAGHELRRVVEVAVENYGGAPAEAHLRVTAQGKSGGSAVLLDVRFPLASGQAQTFGVTWDGRGVGAFTVTASITVGPPHAQGPELRGAPNVARADHYLVDHRLAVGIVADL